MTEEGVARQRILVVDDDASLAEMLQLVLSQEGYGTQWCARGDQALGAFREGQPDLVLLDLMLPGRDGVDVCRDIRAESGVPIVMLTAKSDTSDVVDGLEAGADDYIPKPFKPRELVARVRTRLRRPHPGAAESIRLGDIVIAAGAHTIHRDGRPIGLTPLEFDLLLALARRPEHVFTREELLRQVWGYRHAADTRLVNVHVQRLRAKIERDPDNPEVVVTVRGIGYRSGPGA
ncbi:MAG: response regulator transcription factor [Propionibacteriaceae bacterium]|jgi:two-component system response regulator MtrA|nr:response regulator transcription factor [Propionibacteriaceae bacterium]